MFIVLQQSHQDREESFNGVAGDAGHEWMQIEELSIQEAVKQIEENAKIEDANKALPRRRQRVIVHSAFY